MKKRVVIIGGGFAGSYIAEKLQNAYTVTLIDSKDYFEFTPSVLRTIVEPEHIKKIQALHRDYLPNTVVHKDEVVDIMEGEVVTPTHTFPYDYLVISSGSDYNSAIKDRDVVFAARADELVSYTERLRLARSVLIIGGGLVGVELASEIVEKYPGKRVIIVHGNAELIERNPRIARIYAYKFLARRGVDVIFNEIVTGKKGNVYKTNANREINADLSFFCTGLVLNYKHLTRHFSQYLEKKGIKVNRYLQVEGLANVFAAGDITNMNEEKTAQNAEKHAKIVVDNINALEMNYDMKEYISKPRPMVISMGKWNGIFVYKNLVLTGIIPAFMKWFVEWKTMVRHRP